MIFHRILRRTLSHEQKIAVVLSKSVSATLSLISSSIIIYKLYLRYNHQSNSSSQSSRSTAVVRRGSSLHSVKPYGFTTYHRMLLIISIVDVIHSLSSAFTSVLVPSYTNGTFAYGTTATCSMQGVLQQLTITIVLYMAMLNVYFMIKIRYNVPDMIFTKRYELWFHAVPWLHFFSTAITGLSMRIFGPLILPELGCWLDSYCVFTHSCTRSSPIFYNHLDHFAWSFAYIWLFLCVIVVVVNSILIYTSIREQERRNSKYLAARLLREGLSSNSQAFLKRSSIKEATETVVNDRPIKEHQPGNDTTIQKAVVEDITLIDETTESMNETETTDQRNENDKAMTQTKKIARWDDEIVNSTLRFTPSTKVDEIKATQHIQIKQSRIAAVQSTLYITSALFTAVWTLMPWVGYKLQVNSRWRFFFAIMLNIACPSQGMFNLFIFVRFHYLSLRETNSEWSRWKCVKECLFSAD